MKPRVISSILLLAALLSHFGGTVQPVVFAAETAVAPQVQVTHREEIVPLKLKSGRSISVTLRSPSVRKVAPRHPAILIFGGFQNAGRVLDLIHTEEPVVLASFDYPFDPPRRFEFPQSLGLAPQVKQMVQDTLGGIHELVAYLKMRPDVDPSRITIIGASLGSPFAALAGAAEPDLKGVILVHGFGDIPQTAVHEMMRAWQPRYGIWIYPAAATIAHLGWWYLNMESPEEALQKLAPDQKVLVINAESDHFVPSQASEALWDALKKSRARAERVTMPGDHLMPGQDSKIAQILSFCTRWMGQQELL